MAFKDLREFIEKVREMGQLEFIEGADRDNDIGSLTEIFAERNEHPLLLFDNIKGYKKGFRVASDILTDHRRTALAVGLPPNAGKIELVKMWKERIKDTKPIPPKEVSDGPIFENVEQGDKVDLLKFPSPMWHEQDGGYYIGTSDAVVMKDPDLNWVNLGTYRCQVHDRNTLGIYISPGHHGRIIREKFWAKGKSCPVAVSFGQDPTIAITAAFAVPYGSSELDFAGWMRGAPAEVVKGPLTGLPIPAAAEIAIEGEIPPPEVEHKIEGPFGEWPGYYAHGARDEPVIKVRSVMYRNDPIIAGSPPLKPHLRILGLPFGAASIWDNLEKMGVPDIHGVWTYASSSASGGGMPFIVISLKQRYHGHAKQAALVAMGGRTGAYLGRYVVVVDEDIDPTNLDEVVWAIASRSDPATDIDIIRKAWSTYIDPRMTPKQKDEGDITNSRAIIMAVRPYEWIKQFPPVNAITPEQRQKAVSKWKNLLEPYGLAGR
ncbi:MAG: UbiD family decarboxylase [Thaumarchaeota archaeon]|nr:UbiD family decarboxylase [Nitrososphaerota archaeon]